MREEGREAALPRTLHVLNGDSARGTLEQAGVRGSFGIWADILHEGPVPADLEPEELGEVRARFIASLDMGWTYEMALAERRRWYECLASFKQVDEVVLWFEHDLFDQLKPFTIA
jgi:hypothetical protein